jgi:1-acyl-sn-glycerol-3-phosphate acyltransferase
MRITIFSTPALTPALRVLAIFVLKLTGWKILRREIKEPSYVLIGAPHTSNWDFPLMLLAVLDLRLKVFWMGKDSLFKFPAGSLMKWLGGIPIDRSKPNNMVQETVQQFQQHRDLVVLIPPEGTRSKVEHWKTGFYRIASAAGLPILLGYIDAPKKEIGLADFFYPSGDIDTDIRNIRAFYSTKKGIRPENG